MCEQKGDWLKLLRCQIDWLNPVQQSISRLAESLKSVILEESILYKLRNSYVKHKCKLTLREFAQD